MLFLIISEKTALLFKLYFLQKIKFVSFLGGPTTIIQKQGSTVKIKMILLAQVNTNLKRKVFFNMGLN